jgi:hypothetical protein
MLIMPAHPIRLTTTSAPSFQMGVADLQIDFTGIEPDLPKAYIIAKVNKAARAVAAYYGRFPVSSARIVIVVAAGEHGILRGTTWGKRGGFPAVTRLVIGQHTTQQEFDTDWIVTMSWFTWPWHPCQIRSTGWKKVSPLTSNRSHVHRRVN